jgi:hypothetical protein
VRVGLNLEKAATTPPPPVWADPQKEIKNRGKFFEKNSCRIFFWKNNFRQHPGTLRDPQNQNKPQPFVRSATVTEKRFGAFLGFRVPEHRGGRRCCGLLKNLPGKRDSCVCSRLLLLSQDSGIGVAGEPLRAQAKTVTVRHTLGRRDSPSPSPSGRGNPCAGLRTQCLWRFFGAASASSVSSRCCAPATEPLRQAHAANIV